MGRTNTQAARVRTGSARRGTRGWLARIALIGALFLNLLPGLPLVPTARAAAGAPLLVLIDSATNPFSIYLQEILNAEGIKDYEIRPLSDLTGSALLTGRRAVILGESNPSAAQVAALDAFVSAGGGLIAMRPAASLDTVLGVTKGSATLTDGYVKITDPTFVAGLYADTMQFHGTSSRYTLAGASAIAGLFSDRATATGQPAVTVANRGAGKAALFSYDLARSVALTRQGNPANSNTDTDGDGIVRTNDLFRGWIDLDRASVPQADMQQRLLVRLIETVGAQPVPRLWYFPGTASSVMVATSDAHGQANSDFQVMIDAFRALGVATTFYLQALPWAQHPSPTVVEGWRAQGFDFGPHPYSSGGYGYNFADGYAAFDSWYPAIDARTERTHEVRWSGWTTAASEEAAYGTAMDFNFYQFASWLTPASYAGYLTGSGQPMRFIDANGTILPIYQQHTNLVDEQIAPSIGYSGYGLDQALATSRSAIDASVATYHTPIVTQFHVGYWTYAGFGEWVSETARYAHQTHGLPSLTAANWLKFTEERAATQVTNSAWNGTTLTFNVSAGGTGQTILIPLQYNGHTLSSVTAAGAAISYPTKAINGTAYAMVSATSGAYVASYATDQTPPVVSATAPQANATNVSTTAPLSVTFSESMDRTATAAAFALNPSATGTLAWSSGDTILTFTPTAPLAPSTAYTATVSASGRDRAGNPLTPASWSFTTAATQQNGPHITNVTAGTITPTSVTITWTTDIAADSQVDYGPTAAYGSSTARDAALTTSHSQTISGLAPATSYHFRVRSGTPGGTAALSPDGIFTTSTAEAPSAGAWSPILNWPLVAVHAIMQPTGEVLLFDAWEYSGTPSARLWDPNSNSFTSVPNSTTELFCAGHAMLADGRQLVIGGHAGDAIGIPNTNIFDSRTNSWIRVADMHYPRWYPTAITLTDGRVLALGGQSTPGVFVQVPEVYDPATNTWTALTGAALNIGEYPRAALMPDGRVFVAAASTPMQSLILDVAAQQWTSLGLSASTGSTAIYGPGKVLAAGGGTGNAGPVRPNAATIDLNGGVPTWQATAPMAFPRYQHNLVTLPDGTVLALGGTTEFSLAAQSGILPAELWNPATGTWTTLAAMGQPRLYHSTALLLPDGRVLVAGGGRAAPAIDYQTAQLYSPPYLFAGPRPSISSAPISAGYDRALTVWTPDSADIASVALVRLPSVTHALDFDQRYIPLSFTKQPDKLTVQSPGGAGVAPPGVYMLFVVNSAGVPSVASMIQIGGGTQTDTQSPTVALTSPSAGATVAGTATPLSATATDDVAVASVQFLLDGTPLGAPVTTAPYTLAWDTTTTSNGTHVLSAQAQDGVGNTTISAAITITVANTTSDTTPPIISALATSKITSTYATLTWTTDEGATSQVEWGTTAAYGNITTLDPTLRTAHSRRLLGLTPNTTYHFRVISRDAAGNATQSADGTFTTLADTQPPSVALTAPVVNSVVSGRTVTVAASASDNVAVASVQFLLDGAPLGAPQTTAPYTLDWDTASVHNGAHTLSAQARDSAGNVSTSSPVPITVSNTIVIEALGPTYGASGGGTVVTIVGSGFAPGATVSFDGVAATQITVLSATRLTATAPAHAPGAVGVVVTNSDGSVGAFPAGFEYVACSSSCQTQSTTAQFGLGTATGLYNTGDADGELTLALAAGAEFAGNSLPAGWNAAPWGAGGSATVANGTLTVDEALVTTTGYFAPGRSLEFEGTFDTTAAFQHVGLGIDLNNVPWAIFSTGGGGGNLYARTNAAGGGETALGSGWLGTPHRFRITWTTTSVTYFIDGQQVAAHATGNSGEMRPVISDGAAGGGTIKLDWIHLGPYAAAGNFLSGVLDAGGAATWGAAHWRASVPTGTTLTLSARSGNTPTPDASWTAFAPLTHGAAVGTAGRYLQYRADFATTDPAQSPQLADITFAYTAGGVAGPTVGGISPANGPLAGGTTVTISGSGFTGATAVTFGGTAATAFTVTNATTITATTPAHAAGPVDVVVTTPAGASPVTAASRFTYGNPPPTAPTVTAVAPATGPTAGGTAITITGTNFVSGATVAIGGQAATNVIVASATQITATTPAHTAGAVAVAVTNPDSGSGSMPNAFTYAAAAPAITGLNPTSGPAAGGTSVTITGSGFTGATAVAFGGTAATYTVTNDTTIVATTPAHAAGAVAVSVTTPAGTSPANANANYTYQAALPAPSVTEVAPGTGSAAGGAVITITGANLTGATAVSFGGTAATAFTVLSATQITATAPAHAAGAVDLQVTTPGGTSPLDQNARYIYVACPTACVTETTTAQFAAGTVGTGATIAQSGDGALTLAPAVGAEFGGTTLPAGWSATAWATGGGATVANGQLAVDGALVGTESYFAPGRTLEFTATFDPTAPYQHLGLGIDLNGGPWAIFSTGGSGGALYARSNGPAGTFDTLVPGNWLGAPHRFTITWTTTAVIYAIDGTPLVTHNLGNTGDLRPVASDGVPNGATLAVDWLRLGPYAATGTFTSAVLDAGGAATWGAVAWTGRAPANTTLIVSARSGNTPTPDGSWGAFAPLTQGGTVGSSGRYFQYRVELTTTDPTQTPQLGDITVAYTVTGAAGPAIGSIAPASGTTAGGTIVTISGSGFTGATAVTFGGTAATNFTVTNDTTITATTPAHAAGQVDLIVTTPVGASAPSSTSRYTYVTPPPGAVAVTAVTPTSGATTGGTVVTITGANFAAGAGVSFGGTAATTVTVNSATQITATTPAHAAGAVTIVVTNSDGRTGSLANGYTYAIQPPTVSGVSPANGPTAGGTAVTISGSGFTGATAVTFGGTAATAFTVTNDTTITATAPARAAGPVDVVVTTPVGASPVTTGSKFTYTPPAPTVERIAPGTGPAAGGTTVSVRGKHFTGATAVRFGGTDGSNLVVQSDTILTVVAPAGAAGTIDLRVVTPGGTSATGDGARFTYVACLDGCRAQSTTAAFGGGTASNTYLSEGLDGEIALAPAFGAEFGGSTLPTGMSVAPWSSGGTASVGDGRLTVDAALVASNGYLTPGRRIEFIATFDPVAPYQHIGLGHDLNNTPWAIFSTGSGGGQLYARTNTGGSSVDTPITGDWIGAAHQFAIIWTTSAITYTIDGVQVANHALGNTGDLRPVISDGAPGGATLAVEWLRATPYAATGTYTSGILDAGARADWRTIAWTERVPDGTSLSVGVRSGDTATPDGSWSAFGIVTNGGSANLTGRYLQYRATLTTTDPALTPSLDDITIGFALASLPAPTVTGLNPNSGPSAGGTVVTISGSGFTGAAAVTFGGTAATAFTVTNDTTITATAPARAAGPVDVVVTTPGGSSPVAPGGRYTYTTPPPSAPTVTSLSPTGGPATGGTSVTITGTNFTGATAVTFGGTAASAFTVTSATTITATAPAHAAGAVNVIVTTPAGDSATGAGSAYTYAQPPAQAAPTITALSPTGGPAAGGTTVTITGTSFTGATAVTFGGTAASSFNVSSATSISAVAPAGSSAVDVVVTTSAGASPATAASRYTYAAPPPTAPTISAVSPTTGSTAGGTAITLTGTNFVTGATVTVGGQTATNVVVASATRITATTPANAAGAVAIVVTNPDGGSATRSNAFTYTAPAPTITGVSPTGGPTAGGTAITITGTNFIAGATVTIGGQPATAVTTASATQITATTPARTAGAASVVVTNPDGKAATAANAFTYAAPPTITGLSPTSGPVAGNTSVTINGTGFVNGNTVVTFDGTAGTSLSVSSATRLTVRTPAHAAGEVNVVVTVWGVASPPATFTYVAPPTIADVSPNAGPLGGGTTVTIAGTDFGGATAITFGGVNATSYTVENGTTITAVTPSRASAGTVAVRVVTPYGAVNTPTNERFTYAAVPTVTSLSPTSGPAAGGTNVTINGSGFTGATAVAFGSVAATSFTIVSSTRITARTPAQAAGAVTVSVTTPGGTSVGGTGAQFTYSGTAESAPLVASRVTTLARTALVGRSRRATAARRRAGATHG